MRRIISTALAGIMLAGCIAATPVKADNDPKPTEIKRLSHTSKTVKTGKEFELKAYTGMKDYDDDYLEWSVSNQKIVRFEDDERTGDDMEFEARKEGTAYITCRISGTDIKRTCKVKVVSGKARITVEDTNMDVDRGEWEDIEAKLVGGRYKNRKLTYKVSNKKVIRVKRGRVYGKRIGRAKITIRAKADKKIKKVVFVRVEEDD